MNNEVNALSEAWKLAKKQVGNKTIYYADCDKEIINKIVEDEKYQKYFEVLPQPYWGNITNPSIVVLSLNPSYVITDKVDDIVFQNYNKYNDDNSFPPFINYLDSSCEEDYAPMLLTSTSKWWKETLDSFLITGDGKTVNIAENIGFFNLCGYHSENYGVLEEIFKIGNINIENKEIENFKMENLPSSQKMVKHVASLIEKKECEYVIVLWRKGNWEKAAKIAGIKEKFDNVFLLKKTLYVNKGNRFNHTIMKAENKELVNKIRNFIFNGFKNYKIKKN